MMSRNEYKLFALRQGKKSKNMIRQIHSLRLILAFYFVVFLQYSIIQFDRVIIDERV